MSEIKLGDEVQDVISGFKGIAIGKTKWLHGCDRIIIAPRVDKDGKVGDNHSFDDAQVKVLKKKKAPPKKKAAKKGGPRMTPRQKATPIR